MKENIALFEQFGRVSKNRRPQRTELPNVVVYTRVSSKEQADNNMSLETQQKIILDCANRTSRNVLCHFGGTYESAKTDGRKEFMRMLDYIKKNKGKVQEIMVYTLDRFSRTGGAAIKLAGDLREKYGVNIYAVTQPVDTSNPSGVLSQGIHLLFSEFDNKLRGQRVVAGLKARFEMGIWALKPPQGYDIVTINGERQLIINEDGRKIARAFQWKIEGLRNVEIEDRLKSIGVPHINKMKVQRILSNPFYCGILANGVLDGKVVEGKHEKLISHETFLRVNNIINGSNRFNISHKKENPNLPLKLFTRCSACDEPLTGYECRVKVKAGAEQRFQYYYKCRRPGCNFNKNIKFMHEKFEQMLSGISFKQELIEPLLFQLKYTFNELNDEGRLKERYLNKQLNDIVNKINVAEEKYFIGSEMTKELYEKFLSRFNAEKTKVIYQISELNINSNSKYLLKVCSMSEDLLNLWRSANLTTKQKLQQLIFPKGLIYNKTLQLFQAEEVNTVLFNCS